jgi:hypothetical protein
VPPLAPVNKDPFKETPYEQIGSTDELEERIERAAFSLGV